MKHLRYYFDGNSKRTVHYFYIIISNVYKFESKTYIVLLDHRMFLYRGVPSRIPKFIIILQNILLVVTELLFLHTHWRAWRVFKS